jgi:hypothetical protein
VKPFLYDIPRFPLKKFLGKVTITSLFSSFPTRIMGVENGNIKQVIKL